MSEPPYTAILERLRAAYAGSLPGAQQRSRFSSSTAHAYLADTSDFFAWCEARDYVFNQLTRWHLEEYLAYLAVRYRPTTVRRKLASLRALFKTLRALGLIRENPATEVRLGRSEGRSQTPAGEPLTSAQLDRLLRVTKNSPKDIRDRAILGLITVHRLRVFELCGLNLADVDCVGSMPVSIRVTGRSADRVLELTEKTSAQLRRWLAVRGLLKPDSPALFVSLHWTAGRSKPGQRLSSRGIRQTVDTCLQRAGVKRKGLCCDSLRRTPQP